jgi:MFS transporter, DHA1 family, tetracycline resistance protein
MREHRAKLSTIFLIVFIDLVGFGMIIPILPLWAQAYHPSPAVMGLLMATFSLLQFIGAPVLGRWSDRSGRRPVLLISLLGAATGYGLLAVARSLPMLFLSRSVAGLAGGNIATAQAVITDITGPENRAKGMGLLGAAFGLGFIVGPAVGGLLVGIHPWLPGLAPMCTSLVAFVMTWFLLPETRQKGAPDESVRRTFSLARFRAAMAHPLLGTCLIINFLLVFAFANFESTFAQFLNLRHGLTPRQVSYVFVLAGLISVVVQGGIVGRLARRLGDASMVTMGTFLGGIALALVPLAPRLTGLFGILALFAFGQGVSTPTLSSLSSKLVPAAEIGAVMGVYQSISSLARIAGPFWGQVVFGGLGAGWPYYSGAVVMIAAAALGARVVARMRHPAAVSPTA